MLKPPGPKPHALLGNLREFRRDPLDFLTSCARNYGEIACFHVFRKPVYLLSNPEHIEYVLSTNSRNFVKGRTLRATRALLGNGLFTTEGAAWLRLRKLNQPAFRRERMGDYADAVLDCTRRMLRSWHPGDLLDLHGAMNDLTVNIAVRALFGVDIEDDAAEVGAALHVILKHFRAQLDSGLLLPAMVPTPGNLTMRRALARLDRIVYRIIRERRTSGRRTGDLLTSLIHPADPSASLSDRELRDEVVTLLVAGHETTSVALLWTWCLLSDHPGAESRLWQEIDAVTAGEPLSLANLRRLEYTGRVFLEAMRLYPPAWTTPRTAIDTCTIGGYAIPAGASVTMSQWVMHRDPRFFGDPALFDPDRWKDGLLARLPRFVYFPFGGGPRGCIGESIAMVEAVLILAAIAQRFRLVRTSPQPVELWPTLTLHPRGPVQMKVLQRR